MKKLTTNSKRQYVATWIDGNEVQILDLNLDQIMFGNPKDKDNQFEYIYALQDVLDEILDMKLNEVKVVQFNRDDKSTLGVIKRIK